jgi:hypothetical protein
MSFTAAAVIMGGASLVGGFIGADATRKAARQQMEAIERAKGEIGRAYGESKGYYTPYQEAGAQGLNALRGMMEYKPMTLADMQQDPGYQFRLQEGLKQLGRTASARGGALSGATLRGTQGYAQNLASEEYQNAFNRYLTNRQEQLRMPLYFSNMGMQTASDLANLSTSYGSNIANLIGQGGQAQAAGTMGAANAWSNALGGISNAAGSYMMANAMAGKSPAEQSQKGLNLLPYQNYNQSSGNMYSPQPMTRNLG